MEYAAPKRDLASRTSAGGDAAPPTTSVCTQSRSYDSRSSRSSNAICGATPPTDGMRCSAMHARASAARHRPSTWVVVPSRRYHGSLVMKPTWANWVPASIGVGAVSGSPHASSTSMRVTAASCRSRNSAPFGCPVVPEVNTSVDGAIRVGSERCHELRPAQRLHLVGARERERAARQGGHRLLLGRRQPGVHPCGDRAHLGGGGVGDHVGRVRRQAQQHHVARAHARRAHPGGDLVGAGVERRRRTGASRRGRRRPGAARSAGRPPAPWRRASPDDGVDALRRTRTPAGPRRGPPRSWRG